MRLTGTRYALLNVYQPGIANTGEQGCEWGL